MKDIDLIKSKLEDLQCADSYVFSAIQNIKIQIELLEKIQKTLYSAELYLIYKHTSPDGKVYIGITKNLPNARWNEGAGYETQKKFYKAIQTYGWINFKHEIIAAGLSENEAKKMESELILASRSNEDEFGYNTQVLHSVKENSDPRNKQTENRNSINNTDIANEIINKFSIRTIDETIYYLKDERYIREKDCPIIKKELLLLYKIEARKQKEIIEQIKILSYSKREDVFQPEDVSNSTKVVWNSDISSFFEKLTFEKSGDFFISDDELYDEYLIWCNQWDVDAITKTDFIKKTHSWMKTYRPEVERIVTSSNVGWEICAVVLKETNGKLLTAKGLMQISKWLENTKEDLVCVQMICEKALGLKSRGSRKLGNEICFALRNTISGWQEVGVQRTREYGNQLCFVRKGIY